MTLSLNSQPIPRTVYLIKDQGDKVLNPITVDGTTYYINITDDTVGQFADSALEYATSHADITPDATQKAGGTTVTVENLDLGYYLVHPRSASVTDTTVCSLDSTAPDATIELKAVQPTIQKKIVPANGGEGTDYCTASIGDKVSFQITSTVPKVTGYSAYKKFFFVIEDTLSAGLIFNNDINIVIGNTYTFLEGDYDLKQEQTDGGATKVTIVFKDFYNKVTANNPADPTKTNHSGEQIVITYSATVDTDAVLGNAGNTNSATLTYSSDPNQAPAADPTNEDLPSATSPVETSPVVQTTTYVTSITIEKIDKDGTKLTGAKFGITGDNKNITLQNNEIYVPTASVKDEDVATYTDTKTYYMLEDGNFSETGEGATYYKLTKVDAKLAAADGQSFTTEGYVDENGKIVFAGLGVGKYTITELAAPDGYNLLAQPIVIDITFANGVGFSFARDTVPAAEAEVVNGMYTIQVVNSTGFLLPSTGGIGTVIFTVAGAAIMLGAALFLIIKRKKEAAND